VVTIGGLFGVVSKEECIHDLFFGTDYHSHLGTKYGGLAVRNDKKIDNKIKNIEGNYFRSQLESHLDKLSGRSGLGVISDTDAQPLVVNSILGEFSPATVGIIKNYKELTEIMYENKIHFTERRQGKENPTELVSMLIDSQDSIEAGLIYAQEMIKGSCSILLLTKDGIYAARDKLGRTPIVIGKKKGAFAAASETCSFPNLGYEVDEFLGPGEIRFITADGHEQIAKPGNKMQVCAFLWVYYGFPTSDYERINVEKVRNKCGVFLAKDDEEEIDIISGIPDSGIGHALGYSLEKNKPYFRPFAKYTPTWPRSFMPQNQETRDLVAKMKLIPNRAIIEEKKILFCEDSIVRGTQLKDTVKILFEYGAKEVHMRPACPTLVYPCEFLNFSTSRRTNELAGRLAIEKLEGREDVNLEEYAKAGTEKNLAMIEVIRETLGLTSLKYQKLDDLVKAIGLPKEKLCTHCWDNSSYF